MSSRSGGRHAAVIPGLVSKERCDGLARAGLPYLNAPRLVGDAVDITARHQEVTLETPEERGRCQSGSWQVEGNGEETPCVVAVP